MVPLLWVLITTKFRIMSKKITVYECDSETRVKLEIDGIFITEIDIHSQMTIKEAKEILREYNNN